MGRSALFRRVPVGPDGGHTVSGREAYQERLEAQVEKWQARIDMLKAKADAAKADAKIDLYEQIEELEKMQADARNKLEQLRSATEDSWEDMREGFEDAWQELAGAMNMAIGRFQGSVQ